MKKLELYILTLGVILCATVRSAGALDQSGTNRFIVWTVITILLVMCILVRSKITDFSVFKRAIFYVFAGYSAMAFFSYNSNINQGEWVYETLKILLMLIYFGAACLILKNIKDIAKPLTVLTICIGIYGIWSLKTRYIEQGLTSGIATMGNKNMWAQAMLFLIPFCISVFRSKEWKMSGRYDKQWKMAGFMAIVIALINIIMSESRGAILALAVAIVLTSMIFNKKAFIAFLILGMIGSIGIYCSRKTTYVEKMLNTESSKDRGATWKQTLIMTNDSFMVGAGQWKITAAKYAAGFKQKLSFKSVYYNRPHNDFLWVLAELSILGLICYSGIFLLALWYAAHGNNVLVFAGLTAYTIIAFVSYPKERAFLSMIGMIYMALAINSCHPESNERTRDQQYIYARPKWNLSLPVIYINSVIILTILSLCLYDFSIRYQMDIKAKRVHAAKEDGINEIIIKELSHIAKLATVDTHGIPYHYYRGIAYYSLGDKEKGMKDYAMAYTQNPYHYYNLLSLGRSFFEVGMPERAKQFYEEVLRIRPSEQTVVEDLDKINKVIEAKNHVNNKG